MNAGKLFARLVENWPVKVLSVGLAVILFVFHRMSTLEERFFSAPLNIELADALLPSASYPRMVRVSLRGEANSIIPILDDDIEVYVSMSEFTEPGTYNVPVSWRKKGTALGVEPLEITVEPMEMTISLDRKISKFVPVVANLRGQVETGYTMISYSLNPAQVTIDGPAGLMSGIAELYTELIDLDGRREDFSASVQILHRDPLMVIRGNGMVEFRGSVNRIIPVRNIANVPIAVSGLREDFSAELEIKAGSLHLEGENQDAVDGFEPPPDFLGVDCSGISEPGIYILKVIPGAAGNLSVSVEPEEVKIQISPAGEGNRE